MDISPQIIEKALAENFLSNPEAVLRARAFIAAINKSYEESLNSIVERLTFSDERFKTRAHDIHAITFCIEKTGNIRQLELMLSEDCEDEDAAALVAEEIIEEANKEAEQLMNDTITSKSGFLSLVGLGVLEVTPEGKVSTPLLKQPLDEFAMANKNCFFEVC